MGGRAQLTTTLRQNVVGEQVFHDISVIGAVDSVQTVPSVRPWILQSLKLRICSGRSGCWELVVRSVVAVDQSPWRTYCPLDWRWKRLDESKLILFEYRYGIKAFGLPLHAGLQVLLLLRRWSRWRIPFGVTAGLSAVGLSDSLLASVFLSRTTSSSSSSPRTLCRISDSLSPLLLKWRWESSWHASVSKICLTTKPWRMSSRQCWTASRRKMSDR